MQSSVRPCPKNLPHQMQPRRTGISVMRGPAWGEPLCQKVAASQKSGLFAIAWNFVEHCMMGPTRPTLKNTPQDPPLLSSALSPGLVRIRGWSRAARPMAGSATMHAASSSHRLPDLFMLLSGLFSWLAMKYVLARRAPRHRPNTCGVSHLGRYSPLRCERRRDCSARILPSQGIEALCIAVLAFRMAI